MRRLHRAVLLAAGAMLLAPVAVHAQLECESYGVYNPATHGVYGYSRTELPWGGIPGVGVDSYLYDPNYSLLSWGEIGGAYIWVEYDVSGLATLTGWYRIVGFHYEIDVQNATWWMMAQTEYDVYVDLSPPPVEVTGCVTSPAPWHTGSQWVSISGSGLTGADMTVTGDFINSYDLYSLSDNDIEGTVDVGLVQSAGEATVWVGGIAACLVP